jgi:putative heme-binding domain-containing protein
MSLTTRTLAALSFALPLIANVPTIATAATAKFALQKGDHICYIGNTMADRMQHHAWLESMIVAAHPKHDLSFRNLGFAGDEVTKRPRSASFGSPDQWLTKCKADVVFCFFGYNEALRGSVTGDELAGMIDGMKKQKYNGKSAPRLVVFSPIAHEDLNSPHLPDGSKNNKNLSALSAAWKKVCDEKGVLFVDLFAATQKLYAAAKKPLTMNGIHLLDHGNRAVAPVIMNALFDGSAVKNEKELLRLREAVLDKNLHWFSRYRVVDGFNVYGGRSRLNWHKQSNYDVMQREMAIFDAMTANRDKRIWSVAQGGNAKVDDSNIPKLLVVKTNRPGKLPGGKYKYLSGKEGIAKMKIAEGMQVNLFASEEMFPEMINPVQMAVDTDGRLFASVWPSYPHWNPTKPRTDRLVCLPDENGDGVADKCIVFADKMNSITGFEFWGGGVLVSAPPEIWFLKDTDGDDKADVKIRMLQGVSSADTHHTANAWVIDTAGKLYWSRGVFHVTNMETPTKTFRSGGSGVYQFDPRTFEINFHFPIGPNPHGDVIDQWGYQFVNDGTGGTGSYANIGKGQGNRKWFRKRVRPVAATGILSSSHFPEKNNGNFLICNTIGFLGVLQHEVKYNGAEITAHEIEPILVSSDPNFRPTDVEIGGDGALYVSDWSNALIGHMQHNIRDPNRDHQHGRIYRVTAKGRPLMKPLKLRGKPIEKVCEAFYVKSNSARYRARLELSGRDTKEVVAAVGKWVAKLDVAKPDDAQAMLECLWTFEEHRVPNLELLNKIYSGAKEEKVRAATIRTLGHWAGKVKGGEATLIKSAADSSALVRAEAIKAAVEFGGVAGAETIFVAAAKPSDSEIAIVMKYARGKINVDALVQEAVKSGKPLSRAAAAYALRNASVDDLLKMKRTEAVYRAILSRKNVAPEHLKQALEGLSKLVKANAADLLLKIVEERDSPNATGSLASVAKLLLDQPVAKLLGVKDRLAKLATAGKSADTRQLGYAALIVAEGKGDAAFTAASKSKKSLRDVLAAVSLIENDKVRGALYANVRPLISKLPAGLAPEPASEENLDPGIHVDFFRGNPGNADIKTFSKKKPNAGGTVKKISNNIRQARGIYGLRFTGTIQIGVDGKYTFYTNSDDGSRLYLDGKLVVNNDGNHGPEERSGSINLSPGSHKIVVTYFNSGGGAALSASYAGPGINKQEIPANKLFVVGGETLHDLAIRAFSSIPGHDAHKFNDLAALAQSGKSRTAAVSALLAIPADRWPKQAVRPLAEGLAAQISKIPAKYRTGRSALEAMKLVDMLAAKLPAEEAREYQAKLAELAIRVTRIGTVPQRMIYDKERLVVQAGKPVEFVFTNTDHMPHNFVIVQPGAMKEVGELAEATSRAADAIARHYVPKSNKILLSSRLLEPGQTQALSFQTPKEPGIYPYICTVPLHWTRMNGALYVVADLKSYLADPKKYLAANPLPLKDELLKYNDRNTEWQYDALTGSLKNVHMGRNFEVGKSIFKAAACVACHKIGDEGRVFGPDLTKLDAKKHTLEHLLRSILEPSKEIDPKYQTYTLVLSSGKQVTGMILSENAKEVKLIVDPIAKPEPIVIPAGSIVARKKQTISQMPKGLANKFSREEILDLLAYLYAKGDKKHKLYKGGHKH